MNYLHYYSGEPAKVNDLCRHRKLNELVLIEGFCGNQVDNNFVPIIRFLFGYNSTLGLADAEDLELVRRNGQKLITWL